MPCSFMILLYAEMFQIWKSIGILKNVIAWNFVNELQETNQNIL